MIFIILLAVIGLIIVNFVYVKKIANKTYKFCIWSLNVMVLFVFSVLITAVGVINDELNGFIDAQIGLVENKANEIYPGALDLQMSTVEVKNLLEQSLTFDTDDKLESIIINVIKSNVSDYTAFVLKTINKLERTENQLSVKEALISLKEICIETVKPYYRIACTVFTSIFFLYLLLIVVLCKYLEKNQKTVNDSIVFGDEAASTEIGMKVD